MNQQNIKDDTSGLKLPVHKMSRQLVGPVSERWEVHGELRYGKISDTDLAEEGGIGRLTGLNYQPLTLQFGHGYRF